MMGFYFFNALYNIGVDCALRQKLNPADIFCRILKDLYKLAAYDFPFKLGGGNAL